MGQNTTTYGIEHLGQKTEPPMGQNTGPPKGQNTTAYGTEHLGQNSNRIEHRTSNGTEHRTPNETEHQTPNWTETGPPMGQNTRHPMGTRPPMHNAGLPMGPGQTDQQDLANYYRNLPPTSATGMGQPGMELLGSQLDLQVYLGVFQHPLG